MSLSNMGHPCKLLTRCDSKRRKKSATDDEIEKKGAKKMAQMGKRCLNEDISLLRSGVHGLGTQWLPCLPCSAQKQKKPAMLR